MSDLRFCELNNKFFSKSAATGTTSLLHRGPPGDMWRSVAANQRAEPAPLMCAAAAAAALARVGQMAGPGRAGQGT